MDLETLIGLSLPGLALAGVIVAVSRLRRDSSGLLWASALVAAAGIYYGATADSRPIAWGLLSAAAVMGTALIVYTVSAIGGIVHRALGGEGTDRRDDR